jgi:Tfp pilus assembly protein PilN
MTVDIPTRAPEQQQPVEDRRSRRGLKGGPQITFGRSRAAGRSPLVVGGQPRANLLPPEIILKRKQLKTRRALRVGVFFVFLATAAACVGVWGMASVSQVQLALAQEQQQALVNEQLTYGEVREVQNTIATIKAGQQVGGSTEINWRDYLTKLSASLPSGVSLESVSIESGTPMAAFAQADGPLKGDRVAALTFTATSKALPSIPDWLRALEKLPGFVDATPGSVKQEDGVYIADVLMHINADAFSMRFDPAHIAAAEAAAEAASKSDGTIKSLAPAQPASEEAEGPATDDATTEEGD